MPRAGQHGLCSGFHDHQSVPVAISMGALSLHQGGGEDANVARSARQHPELRSHLERQAARRSRSRFADPEAGAIYVMDRGYVDFARLYVLSQACAFFVTRAELNLDAHRVYSAPTDRATVSLPTRLSHWMAILPARTIPFICAASDSRMPHRKKAGVSDQPFCPAGGMHSVIRSSPFPKTSTALKWSLSRLDRLACLMRDRNLIRRVPCRESGWKLEQWGLR